MKAKVKNSPLMTIVFGAIAEERLRQRRLLLEGKISFPCESPTVCNDRKLRVITEELGEVAKDIDALEQLTRDRGEMPITFRLRRARVEARLRAELTQVAAVCVAWLEALEADSSTGANKENGGGR